MTQDQLDLAFSSYKKPTEKTIPKFEMVQQKVKELAQLINDVCPESREKSNALTDLQSCRMFANCSIALHSEETK